MDMTHERVSLYLLIIQFNDIVDDISGCCEVADGIQRCCLGEEILYMRGNLLGRPSLAGLHLVLFDGEDLSFLGFVEGRVGFVVGVGHGRVRRLFVGPEAWGCEGEGGVDVHCVHGRERRVDVHSDNKSPRPV